MPNWEGIEDASPRASRVWFCRSSKSRSKGGAASAVAAANANADDVEWKPLRKVDCQALNGLLSEVVGSSVAGDDNETAGTAIKKLGVYVEEGRCTATLDAAKPTSGTVSYNFVRDDSPTSGDDSGSSSSSSLRQMCSAIWFRREEKSKGEIRLHPIHENLEDADAIEKLYQRAVEASSSLSGEGISSVVNESVELSDESKVTIVKGSGAKGCLKLVVKKKGWFGGQSDLQRGYGEYSVDGEKEESMLRPVGHLCFVIHGIGEAYFSQESVNLSIVDIMNATRIQLHRKQVDEWQRACQAAQKRDLPVPLPPRRIEVVPIEWYAQLHGSETTLMKSLRSTTLQTIPALRSIANDIIFDVMLYLTPTFCEAVLECVTDQIRRYHEAFCQIHPDFAANRGKCSLIGHSLGSVIAWDLLSVLKEKQRGRGEGEGADADAPLSESVRGVAIAGSQDSVEVGYQAYAAHPAPGGAAGSGGDGDGGASSSPSNNMAQHGTWGPTLTKRMQQAIPFEPECTLFLGSPLGIFLTLRGAHAVFDKQRKDSIHQARLLAKSSKNKSEVRIPAASPFTLPTKSLYNIFNASDPVAYRIEPLLLSPDLDIKDLPAPVYLTAPGKDVRLHVKARQIGEEVAKTFQDTLTAVKGKEKEKNAPTSSKSTWSSLVDSTLTALAANSESSLTKNKAITDGTDNDNDDELEPEWPPTFPLGNPSTEDPTNVTDRRVDYSFQPGVVENEYLNAVMAHSSYFQNPDLIDFLVSRLCMNTDGDGDSEGVEAADDGGGGSILSTANV